MQYLFLKSAAFSNFSANCSLETYCSTQYYKTIKLKFMATLKTSEHALILYNLNRLTELISDSILAFLFVFPLLKKTLKKHI